MFIYFHIAYLFGCIVVSLQICNVFVADELYLALVTSTKAHARIIDVDIKAASEVPGFVTWVDHKDIPGTNDLGWYGDVFAEKEVRFHHPSSARSHFARY